MGVEVKFKNVAVERAIFAGQVRELLQVKTCVSFFPFWYIVVVVLRIRRPCSHCVSCWSPGFCAGSMCIHLVPYVFILVACVFILVDYVGNTQMSVDADGGTLNIGASVSLSDIESFLKNLRDNEESPLLVSSDWRPCSCMFLQSFACLDRSLSCMEG